MREFHFGRVVKKKKKKQRDAKITNSFTMEFFLFFLEKKKKEFGSLFFFFFELNEVALALAKEAAGLSQSHCRGRELSHTNMGNTCRRE